MILFFGVAALQTEATTAGEPTVKINQPPEIAEAIRFQTISIGNVSGQYAAAVAQTLENILLNARIQQRPVFRAVTRGTGVKADGILTAEILKATIEDDPYTKTDKICDRYKELPKDASVFRQIFGQECLSNRNVDVSCLRRHADFTLAVRLTEAANSRVVYSEVIHRTARDEACQGTSRPVAEGRQLLAQATNAALQRLKEAITPAEVEIPLVLMPPDSGIEREAERTRMEAAIRFAREERLDRACEMFNEVAETYRTSSVALNFNLGLCEEVNGNAWSANDFYKRADRLTNEPDKRITEALSRAQTTLRRLDAMGKARPEQAAKQPKATEKAAPPQPLLSIAPAPSDPIPPELLIEDKRVALVIGNSKYPTMPLDNPANDAKDMAAKLRKLKFDVVYAENAKLREMDRAFDEYASRLKPGGVALVFYAGHGIQVNGDNWLIPVDATLQNEREVSRQAFALNQIMERLEQIKSAVNIVILDACRNDPFTRSWKRSLNGGGLATVQAPSGTLVAYSTAPGKTAEDGDGRNSPYTKALIKALSVPNLKLEDVFKQAGRSVMQATDNRQVPWNNSSVTGDFYFSASSAPAPVTPIAATTTTAAKGPSVSATRSTNSTLTPMAGNTTSTAAEPAITTLAEQSVAAQGTIDKGPKEFCADRPNFISRQLCESRKCREPQYAADPYCEPYLRKSESALGL